MSRKFNLATLVANQFADATREEMNKAFEIHTNHASPDIDDDALRARLVTMYTPNDEGEIPTMQPPASGDTVPKPRVAGARIPNLRPTGKWEGRMRRVTVHKFAESSPDHAVTLGWEGIKWNVPLDVTVDMPWPYWQSLYHTDFIDDRSDAVTKWPVDPETGKISCERTSRRIKTQRYEDHGDTPGTENLPEDYVGYFRSEAHRTNCFERHNRSALMAIHNILLEPRGPKYNEEAFNATYFRDMKDIDIRIRIAGALGPDMEAMLNEAVYAEV